MSSPPFRNDDVAGRHTAPHETLAAQSGPEPVGGFSRCPQCGATDIAYSQQAGVLVCRFCRATWAEALAEQALGFDPNIASLSGIVTAQGAGEIDRAAQDVVTLKCQGCGAEVVIDSATTVQSRCHWCRSVLSLDARVPNGSVPDAVLPFAVSHDEAVAKVREFVGKRMRYAQRGFRREFRPENVVGVFMPYFVVDVNAEVAVQGTGEIQTRSYGPSDAKQYDADVYHVERAFGLTIDDLVLESSARRAGTQRRQQQAFVTPWDHLASARAGERGRDTANVINAVLPFDTKNAVRYNANYLGRFTSEKRDLDVSQVTGTLARMILGSGTTQIRNTLGPYRRGVRWEEAAVGLRGARFMTVYGPIWLYSHYERKRDGSERLHYIAVNGRTGSVMGSIPVDKKKLTLAAIAAGVLPYAVLAAIVAANVAVQSWM